jgi:CubicO group peptidase (beta-lactamase class C family)
MPSKRKAINNLTNPTITIDIQTKSYPMLRPFHILLFVLLTLAACRKSTDSGTEEKSSVLVNQKVKSRIDSTLKTFVDSASLAGVSALIFEKNNEVYFNAFGFADREANIPIDRNTIVRIYSMTKPVTGVALMKLYEEGAFQLDDPLSKYAPEFSDMKVLTRVDASGKLITEPAKRPITIRDITRHTAGFVNNENVEGLGPLFKEATRKENTLKQLAEKLGKAPLMFHPGEQWAYGPSVDVQAFLVERIAGKPFDQYIKEQILDPLKMSATRYWVPENDQKKFAAMYQASESGALTKVTNENVLSFNNKEWPLKPGGWGLTSTLDDYMRFARMLVNEGTLDGVTILKPETIKLMATNHLSDSVTERMWLPSKGSVGFGIDFAVRLREPQSVEENNGVVGEFFWDGAASTLFWVDPVNDLTAVLFVQKFPFDRKLHKAFRDAVYGEVDQ